MKTSQLHTDTDSNQNTKENTDKTKITEANTESDEITVQNIAKASKAHFTKVIERIEKISVAPGEKGKFQNWGDDVFLEEKCFPELFPFGVGGYLSRTIDEENRTMGFAEYIKHRILSADSRYRRNTKYLFFLLLVKELIQLKRCKQTYLRQATKIPSLTKESVLNMNKEDFTRYNRSYQVFKTMRGTSMYFEEAKKNVMATLRQNGSPSLFLTLSCAEYSWDGLFQEILETVRGRKVTAEEISELNTQQRNRIVSENVVQSTVHFQKRIEKILKLLTYQNFLSDNCPYSVSSYFYRVEFQMRGAPHIHCLLWLEDEKGNSAPTFWTGNSKEENEDIGDKIKKIEKMASLITSASEDDAKCEYHQSLIQKEKLETCEDSCTDCYTAIYNFEKCNKHNHSKNYNCKNCDEKKKMICDFQVHNHTFTCRKKKTRMIIREKEGHGRLDGIIEGPKIMDVTDCRFNFPKFPLNKTMLILRPPKDLDIEELAERKEDLKKMKKFLIRETFSEDNEESDKSKAFKKTTFLEFLFNVGMFVKNKSIEEFTEREKKAAYQRYIDALSVAI